MQNIGLIKKPAAIRDWLTRLGLWEGISAIPPAHAPPLPIKTILWGVDTWDARLVEFEPGMELVGLPTQCRYKSPRERLRAYTLEGAEQSHNCRGVAGRRPAGLCESQRADESQEPPWSPLTEQRADGLLLVFDADPAPPDDLPVFWAE
jgi:hypothetical protein